MRSTELAVPVENTVRALRRLAPGARLRRPRTPDLRAIATALRGCTPAELARFHPGPVARAVLAAQLRELDRAMTGFFAATGPEGTRLLRAAHYSRLHRARPLLDRPAVAPGLHTAALAWAEARGYRLLAGELRGAPEFPREEDGRRAGELAVAALLPRPEATATGREVLLPWSAGGGVSGPPAADGGDGGRPRVAGGGSGPPRPGGGDPAGTPSRGESGWGGVPRAADGGDGRPPRVGDSSGALSRGKSGQGGVPPGADGVDGGPPPGAPGGGADGGAGRPRAEGGSAGSPPGLGERGAGGGDGVPRWPDGDDPLDTPRTDPGGSAFLHVLSVRVTEHGFQVAVHADAPVELLRDGDGLTLRALWWNGLGRVADDLGHEYLVLAKDPRRRRGRAALVPPAARGRGAGAAAGVRRLPG
ncbi:hypothetical protein [Amycolatopsis sp. lyj-23]|uniref:hypothetical protein n=1 Tax=Amycolatopsis sp. lyj-23 TaxID=2789283 RepID=UPI003979C15B